jgi:nanoRNase/pAp phosphatase (c-di-AMP/oligoRNAs hydrolase)
MDLNVDFVILIGTTSVSLRSKDGGFDVGKIAELNRGGGHMAASGCNLTHILGKSLIELVVENIKLK